MAASTRAASGVRVALAGMAALAVPMGIGRFAFTPILPMMQEDAGADRGFSVTLVLACAVLVASALALASIRRSPRP